MSIDIRAVEVADLPALRQFSDRFNRPGSSTFADDFFGWQHRESVAATESGTPAVAVAAFAADGSVKGYVTAHWMRLWRQEAQVPGIWLHEWFVDPESSGVGFQLLNKLVQGYDFVGVAGGSVDTMSVFLRLSPSVVWFELSRLVAVLSPQGCRPLLATEEARSGAILRALTPAAPPVAGVDVRPLGRFGTETDDAWQAMRQGCSLGGNRDADTMNWRYARHPRFDYGRAVFSTPGGDAIMVWRIEPVGGLDRDVKVARLCEVIGAPSAITAAMPHLLRHVAAEGAVLCDFFCSHGGVLDAVTAGGMHPTVTTPYLDLARLFSPLHFDMRRTINMACYCRSADPTDFRRPHGFLFTKGDGNQDRPNP